MKECFLAEDQLTRLLDAVEEQHETVLFTAKGPVLYHRMAPEERQRISLRETRSSFSAKSYFLPVRERLAV